MYYWQKWEENENIQFLVKFKRPQTNLKYGKNRVRSFKENCKAERPWLMHDDEGG